MAKTSWYEDSILVETRIHAIFEKCRELLGGRILYARTDGGKQSNGKWRIWKPSV